MLSGEVIYSDSAGWFALKTGKVIAKHQIWFAAINQAIAAKADAADRMLFNRVQRRSYSDQ